jgi:hypothetical protein
VKIRISALATAALLGALMALGSVSVRAGDGCTKDDSSPDKSSEKSGYRDPSPDPAGRAI